uniref:Gustatory receptor n=1 Tax=Anopheles culicifacies TaxID=139723 RepID=A0A182MRX4_9DIPT
MMVLMQVAVGVAAGMSMTVSSVRVSSLVVSVDFRVMGMTHTLHMSLETVVLVRRVLHNTLGTIGFMQSVSSLDDISISMFPLALVVTGMGILYSILELVARMRVVIFMLVSCNSDSQKGEGGNGDLHHFGKFSLKLLLIDRGCFLVMILMQVAVGVAAGMSMTVSTVRVSSLMVSIDFRVMSMTHTLHMSLETVVLVGRVLDHSFSSVGFMQSVGSLDDISIPMFPLALVVT